MKTFIEFIIEKATQAKELPFEHSPKIGAWKETMEKDGHVTVYHGTHKRHLQSILEKGLSHRDPRTGMISVTHDPHTAHGYAAMSASGGEANFRKVGGKAVHTPHEDRVVLKMHIPKEFVNQHMDHEFHGNERSKTHPNRTKMHDPETYHAWKKDNPHAPDHQFYQVSELRINKEIPPEHIVGYMYKKK